VRYCKNSCKCHSAPLPRIAIKNEKNRKGKLKKNKINKKE
jgi:hypothetical protein